MRAFIFLLSLLTAFAALATPPSDDLQRLLAESEQWQYRNPKQSKKRALQALQLATKRGDEVGVLQASFRLGILEVGATHYQKALQRFQKGLERAIALEEHELVSDFYAGINLAYRNQGNPNTAITSSLQALDYLEKHGLLEAQVKHLNDVGESTRSALMTSDTKVLLIESVINFFFRAEKVAKSLPELPHELARTYNRLAAAYSSTFKTDTALIYAHKSLQLCDQFLKSSPENLLLLDVRANTLNELSHIHMKKGSYEKALRYAREAVKSRKAIGDPIYIIESRYMLARVLSAMKQYEKSNEELSAILEETTFLTHKLHFSHLLASNYEALEDWENAAIYWKQAYGNKHRYESNHKLQIAQEAAAKYQLDKKEQEILLSQAESKRRELENMILWGGLGMSGLLILLLAFNYRRRRAQNHRLKEAHQRLLKLGNFKEQMLGMIIHDLKNPLNTILSYTNQEKVPDARQLRSVHQSGLQMLNLVMNMLDVQKFEETALKLNTQEVSARKLFRQAQCQIELLLEQKSLRLDAQIPANLGTKADEAIMVRTLVNLLTNAIKYSPQNGKIEVTAYGKENQIIWEIKDEGIGIAPEQQEHIFERFVQGQAKGQSYAGATGLGLTFCKMAVEAHGGTIAVRSEIGEGAVFRFSLPAVYLKPSAQKSDALAASHQVSYAFSKEDRLRLLPCIHHLQKYQVYEATQVKRTLDRLEDCNSESVRNWVEAISQSVFACNQEQYEALLQLPQIQQKSGKRW